MAEKLVPFKELNWINHTELQRKPEILDQLINETLMACGYNGENLTQAVSSAAYFLQSFSDGGRYEICSYPKGIIINKFRTLRERTRIFIQTTPSQEHKDTVVNLIEEFKKQYPDEMRLVLPGGFFTDAEYQELLGNNRHVLLGPRKVWRVYGGPDDFKHFTNISQEGYEPVILTADNADEMLYFYERNYRRHPEDPNHSFDPRRLLKFRYHGTRRVSDNRLVTAAGPIARFYYAPVGNVSLVGDLCSLKENQDRTLPLTTVSNVLSEEFSDRPLIPTANLIVADMIHPASRELAMTLGAKDAGYRDWVGRKKKNGS